jgi:hypothetical protein
MRRLTVPEWQQRARDHRERTEPWVTARRDRRRRGATHPVDDFLFDYYPYSISHLQTWHPGFGVELFGTQHELRDFLGHRDYRSTSHGVTANVSALDRHEQRLHLVARVLRGTLNRPMQLSCFGMHEWAMVYEVPKNDIRHEYPLRLAPDDIARTVRDVGLRCTHIDAFRFFTDSAKPLNAIEPTRATQPIVEQPGCLHANMDLYKYAMWFRPFIASERVADMFELARAFRDLDMRAAPYDLTSLGYDPIALETATGRRFYASEQRRLGELAQERRSELFADVEHLLAALTNEAAPSLDSEFRRDPTPA